MAGEITTGDAINSIAYGVEWRIKIKDGTETVTYEKLNGVTQPSDSAVAAEKVRLQAVYDNNNYQRTRAAAYPNIGDQLDSLYHDILNNKLDKTGTWFTGITDVKNTTTLDEILLDGTDGSSTNAGDKVLLG